MHRHIAVLPINLLTSTHTSLVLLFSNDIDYPLSLLLSLSDELHTSNP